MGVRLTIDGSEISAEAGRTILEAAKKAEIYIPSLCSHPDLPSIQEIQGESVVYQGPNPMESSNPDAKWEGCGLCAVEVNGDRVRACATEIAEGAEVLTNSEALVAYRRERLGEILLTHPHACLTCAQAEGCPRTQCSSNVPEEERCCELLGSCELERVSRYIGVPPTLPKYKPRELPHLVDEPLFDVNFELCIGCLRCVRACKDLKEVGAISFVMQDGKPVVGTTKGPTRAESDCRFCGACVEVCPTGALLDKERAVGEDRDKILVPCRNACPAGIDIPKLRRNLLKGEPGKAAGVIRERVPLAFAASYVCFHPCEEACRRKEVGEPVSICRLKRYAVDHDTGEWRERLSSAPSTGKKIAVVGSGPAGLTAAYYLARKGHSVVVHEALESPGGMLLTGIPEYRYPRELLDKDIQAVRDTGVEIRCGSPIDKTAFERLSAECDALYVATGAHLAKRIEVPGSDTDGVYWGVDFLRERALGKLSGSEFQGKQVAVVGGGNVAVDAARVARRLGAERVTVVSLENPEELPAWAWEVEEGVEEGLSFLHRWGPEEIHSEGGRVSGLLLKQCTRVFDEEGRFSPAYDESQSKEISAEAVILAIGQDPSSEPFADCGIRPNRTIQCKDESSATGSAKVFAGGDVVTGPKSFIEAVAAGRAAAGEMDRFLGGDGIIKEHLVDEMPVDHRLGKVLDFASLKRLNPSRLEAASRVGSFSALEHAFTGEEVMAEAGRCLHCDLRLAFETPERAPRTEAHLPFTEESMSGVPETEGVYQLYDDEKAIIAIKGAMDLRDDLTEALEENENARFFTFEEDPMYTKRESELIQQYLQEHGELPGGGDDELDDLF